MRRSRLMSLIEALASVAVGYPVAVLTQMLVFPLFGLSTTLRENLAIGAAFTVVSLARSYVLRRAFEAISKRTRKARAWPGAATVPKAATSRPRASVLRRCSFGDGVPAWTKLTCLLCSTIRSDRGSRASRRLSRTAASAIPCARLVRTGAGRPLSGPTSRSRQRTSPFPSRSLALHHWGAISSGSSIPMTGRQTWGNGLSRPAFALR